MNRMKYHLVEATSGFLNTEVNECHELTNECNELKSDSNVIDRKINNSEDDSCWVHNKLDYTLASPRDDEDMSRSVEEVILNGIFMKR